MNYDPLTGALTWAVARKKCPVGKLAGYIRKDGYRVIMIDGRLYRAGRVAYCWMEGKWPSGDVDHINMDRSDDSYENLRHATRSQNKGNTRAQVNNQFGIKGVSFDARRGKWYARIKSASLGLEWLGYFAKPEDASAAYVKAAIRHFGKFARTA